ncbi:hypothetical protein SFRURICE_008177 [Spodoptera frugiperda]|nr:hypothetical protein SFRURICE_008177 [Spodoptera frugiperda]
MTIFSGDTTHGTVDAPAAAAKVNRNTAEHVTWYCRGTRGTVALWHRGAPLSIEKLKSEHEQIYCDISLRLIAIGSPYCTVFESPLSRYRYIHSEGRARGAAESVVCGARRDHIGILPVITRAAALFSTTHAPLSHYTVRSLTPSLRLNPHMEYRKN